MAFAYQLGISVAEHEYYVTQAMSSMPSRIAASYDQPFGNASAIRPATAPNWPAKRVDRAAGDVATTLQAATALRQTTRQAAPGSASGASVIVEPVMLSTPGRAPHSLVRSFKATCSERDHPCRSDIPPTTS
jgi:hypothetical protein